MPSDLLFLPVPRFSLYVPWDDANLILHLPIFAAGKKQRIVFVYYLFGFAASSLRLVLFVSWFFVRAVERQALDNRNFTGEGRVPVCVCLPALPALKANEGGASLPIQLLLLQHKRLAIEAVPYRIYTFHFKREREIETGG